MGCQDNIENAESVVPQPLSLTEVYPTNIQVVDKIELLDGNSGERKIIEDKSEITTFINSIKDIQLIPHENQEDRVGFNFSISLYEDGERVFGFTSTNLNGTYMQTNTEFEKHIRSFFKKHYGRDTW
ncbi:hypothetical protein NV377_05030 [Paenibacillus sp. T3-5-0-4]|nr:hypothetical protein [Paenibacillus endoradicis]